MINTNMPSNYGNAISPYSPLGRQPVGQESPDNRNTPFKPVEQSAESANTLNQRRNPNDLSGEVDQREELQRQERNQRSRKDVAQRRQQERGEQQQLEQEQQQVRQLESRDAEVRAHERAHSAAGGDLAGAPRYDYERGPDGQNYAVGGEVSISVGEVEGDPEATLEMARQVRRAALAPAEPSNQDRRVAARAAQIELDASQQLVEQKRNEMLAEEQAAIEARDQREADAKAQEERDREREQERDQIAATENQYSAQKSALQKSTVPVTEHQQSAAERFADINNRSFELNRRLIEIGAAHLR